MSFDNTYNRGNMYRDRQPIVLPEGKTHGSAWAAMRTNCTCCSCSARRQRMVKKGWRPQA
jgi:hypothetical protein